MFTQVQLGKQLHQFKNKKMAQIQPITFPILGEATQLMVRVLPFETNATTCGTYYEIQTSEGKSLANGNYNLSEEEFAAWGASNAFIDQLVATHVGVTIIAENSIVAG